MEHPATVKRFIGGHDHLPSRELVPQASDYDARGTLGTSASDPPPPPVRTADSSAAVNGRAQDSPRGCGSRVERGPGLVILAIGVRRRKALRGSPQRLSGNDRAEIRSELGASGFAHVRFQVDRKPSDTYLLRRHSGPRAARQCRPTKIVSLGCSAANQMLCSSRPFGGRSRLGVTHLP